MSREAPESLYQKSSVVKNLFRFRHALCELPHDRIYALRSISGDGNDVPVNYGLTAAEVLISFASENVKLHLDWLLVCATFFSQCDSLSEDTQIPSWVPRWHAPLRHPSGDLEEVIRYCDERAFALRAADESDGRGHRYAAPKVTDRKELQLRVWLLRVRFYRGRETTSWIGPSTVCPTPLSPAGVLRHCPIGHKAPSAFAARNPFPRRHQMLDSQQIGWTTSIWINTDKFVCPDLSEDHALLFSRPLVHGFVVRCVSHGQKPAVRLVSSFMIKSIVRKNGRIGSFMRPDEGWARTSGSLTHYHLIDVLIV